MEEPVSLDAVLHQPVRTMLVAYLAGRGHASFSELKRALGLTDGNLDAHLKKLGEAGYVATSRDESTGRTQTVFRLSEAGAAALRIYFEQLSKLQKLAAGQAAEHPEAQTLAPRPAPA